jgi:hypothetical protein
MKQIGWAVTVQVDDTHAPVHRRAIRTLDSPLDDIELRRHHRSNPRLREADGESKGAPAWATARDGSLVTLGKSHCDR